MNWIKLIFSLLVMHPIWSVAQQSLTSGPQQRISLRPVFGAGGEAARGVGLLGEYGYMISRHAPILEVVGQLGTFRSLPTLANAYRRDYSFTNVLAGLGFRLATNTTRRVYGKIGAGATYHHGVETNEYLKEAISGREVWVRANNQYREVVFTSSLELGMRMGLGWEISLGGMLVTGIGEGNGLLLIGPGLGYRF